MLRKGLLAWAVLLAVPVLLSAYMIVLKDGRRVWAKSPYVVEGSVVKFVGADGRAYQLSLADVDVGATERANPPSPTRRARKVWYNEDLAQLSGGAINVVGSASAAPSAESVPAAETTGESAAGGESLPPKEGTAEYWQGRVRPLREELTRTEQEIQRIRSSQGQASATSNAISTTAASQGTNLDDRLRQLERRRTELQQQIEEIQAEARRQGIPAGWVR